MSKIHKILIYGRYPRTLQTFFESKDLIIVHTQDPRALYDSRSEIDLLISFEAPALSLEIIEEFQNRAIVLHPSYLPWNKGSHPYFWAHIDNTPHGVTIHKLQDNKNEGAIICQQKVDFCTQEKTFRQTHERLLHELCELLIKNWEKITSGQYCEKPAIGIGTFHKESDLPRIENWDTAIESFARDFNQKRKNQLQKGLSLIDAIEEVRTKNNINWMNLLRQSFQKAPNETMQILQAINTSDQKISSLLDELAHLTIDS